MRLVVDAQLPPVLAEWLRRQGHEAVHVVEWAMIDSADHDIWRRAHVNAYVIVTKDSDFEALSTLDRDGPRVLWLRVGNLPNRKLISRLALEWSRVEHAFESGARVVEFW